MRNYEVGGLGLWQSVKAWGNDSPAKELLARPIQLVVNGDKKLQGEGEFTKVTDQEAVYQGKATHPAVTVETETITEYDGCMKVNVTLKPGSASGQEGVLKDFYLDIPVRDEMAPLWHVTKTRIRGNPAGRTPGGQGQVWNSRKLRDGGWPGNFKPYWWLGGEERGISWFADNEKGWVMDWQEKPPCQTLHRRNGVLTLRVHFVQKPISLEKPRTITFGLMASPAKPMRDDWRAFGRTDHRGITFSMGHVFGLPAAFSAKYPLNKDFSSLDAFYKARKGKNVDVGKFVSDWVERNLDYEGATRKLRNYYRGNVRHGVRRGKSDDYFSAYFDEVRGTTTFCEEHPYFRCSWDLHDTLLGKVQDFRERFGTKITSVSQRQWFFGTGCTVPSYRDFAAYFGAKWLRRSIGLYFDNMFFEASDNLYRTSAYRRKDGKIQPSAQVWAKRAYMKRIWVLHKELFKPETPQIMMIHMTNAHILPWESFNQSNLDLEWRGGARAFQPKFSPALLRTESLGRKTGCIPLALAAPENKKREASKTKQKLAKRTRWGGLLVHEIKGGISSEDYPEPVNEFGYGSQDCEVYNYWDENPSLTISDQKCKWLLLKRKDKLMLVLCTWRGKKSNVTIDLDLKRLGVKPQKAVDAEHPGTPAADAAIEGVMSDDGDDSEMSLGDTGEDMKPKNRKPGAWQGQIEYNKKTGEMTVPLNRYGVRIIRLQ